MSTRHNTIRFLWIIARVVMQLSAFCSAFGQNNFDLGGLAGAAMRMGFGARGMGMANSLTAIKTEGSAGYYNPAVVPFQAHPSALLSAGFLPFDRNLNFVSYTQSVKPTGGFSLALINAGVSKIQGRSLDGLPTEMYSTSENEFLFTFGTKVRPDFAVGVSAKILYYSLFESVKSTTVGFDLGIVYAPSDAWTIGAVVADINSKYKWDTSQLYGSSGNTSIDRFPLRRKLAICYSPGFLKGRISGEVEWVGAIVVSRIGAELALQENVTLRGGIDQIDFAGRINSKPSIGFSLQTSIASLRPTIDYGFIVEPYATGGIHILSLRLSFE